MAPKTSAKRRIEPPFEAQKGDEPKKSAKNRAGTGGKSRKRAKSLRKSRKKSSWAIRLLRWCMKPVPKLAYWGLVLGLWSGIFLVGLFGYYAAKLPSANDWAIPDRPPNMRILAQDASLIGNRGITGGKALRLEEMSPYIAQAVIAIEDRRFHLHFGFDPIGFTRAMVRNIRQRKMREGGSTITQQLAKNLFLTPERTFGRKIQELILAVWLETKYSKAEILELYLNRVYFGSGATGVDAASRRYFGKSAKHISVGEAALLAGLLKAPSRYSPARDPALARRRARAVLAAMQREGYLKPGSIDVNNLKPGEYARHFRSGPEHFITDMVVKQVAGLIGDVTQDIVVETTVSPYLMTAAQAILVDSLEKNSKKHRVSQAAIVAITPDGAINALIGGRDYAQSQFNRAIEARRQPGSAFKTFVWLNAMERGLSPGSVVQDIPVRYGKWRPTNYDKKYRGPITLNDAFALSVNTVAAQLTMEAGPRTIANTAKRLGIDSDLSANASLALGTSEVSLLELTSAYAPFANGGSKVRPYLINKITTASGRVLYRRAKPRNVLVVDPVSLSKMNTVLRSVVTRGTGRNARLAGRDVGGKTGTSQEFRDGWFVGYTADMITGVWFGNDDNKPTKKLTGGSLPAKVWRDFMAVVVRDLPAVSLPGAFHQAMEMPTSIPVPTPRPRLVGENTTDNQTTASLRSRVEAVVNRNARKTILDIILGN